MKEMAKSILSRLSCDKDLFTKEFRKLIMWMGSNTEEIEDLKNWTKQYYPNMDPDTGQSGESAQVTQK